ncbi:hypothetical protein ABG807_01995 [Streptococcus iniae]
MTHSLLKKEAKACLENLPGKILLYLLPLLLTLFQFGLQVHQRYLLEMGAAIATAPSLFPLLLRIISAFLFLSASFALLAALRGQKDKLTVNDSTLSLTRTLFLEINFSITFSLPPKYFMVTYLFHWCGYPDSWNDLGFWCTK